MVFLVQYEWISMQVSTTLSSLSNAIAVIYIYIDCPKVKWFALGWETPWDIVRERGDDRRARWLWPHTGCVETRPSRNRPWIGLRHVTWPDTWTGRSLDTFPNDQYGHLPGRGVGICDTGTTPERQDLRNGRWQYNCKYVVNSPI